MPGARVVARQCSTPPRPSHHLMASRLGMVPLTTARGLRLLWRRRMPGVAGAGVAPPTLAPFTTSATTAMAAPAAAKSTAPSRPAATPAPPSSGSTKRSGGGVGMGVVERVYDFKPTLPRHQVVFNPGLWSAGATGEGGVWQPTSRRPGMLLLKCGMCGDYDQWGVRRALTVLKVEDAVVTGLITATERGYTAVQVGAGRMKDKRVTKPVAGAFAKVGIPPPAALAEFRVTPDVVAALKVGTPLDVRHWVPGQHVTVTAVSQGKGFQGAMKRHGFSGQGAAHGNSLSHRVLGSTGCRQDPGKVMKGKKMAGRMGGDTVTVQNLRVYKIDVRAGLVYVEGCVPGKPGTWVRVSDAVKVPPTTPPPFPTYLPTAEEASQLQAWQSGEAYFDPATEAALVAVGKLPVGYVREPPYEWVVKPPEVDPFAIPEDDEVEEV